MPSEQNDCTKTIESIESGVYSLSSADRAAARHVLSGQVVDYGAALQDMQSHPEARYEDEEGVTYAWMQDRLFGGVNYPPPPFEDKNGFDVNRTMKWKRVDPCTIAEMDAYAAARCG
jgi:hypothetical protein